LLRLPPFCDLFGDLFGDFLGDLDEDFLANRSRNSLFTVADLMAHDAFFSWLLRVFPAFSYIPDNTV
jgi:hypothetical protein